MAAQPSGGCAFVGTLMHTPVLGQVEVLRDHLVIVNAAGTITHLGPADEGAEALQQSGITDVTRLSPLQWLMPGFIGALCT